MWRLAAVGQDRRARRPASRPDRSPWLVRSWRRAAPIEGITLSKSETLGERTPSRHSERQVDRRQHRRCHAEPWVLCRAFAGGLAVSGVRLGPAVTDQRVGQCESVWSSRFSPPWLSNPGGRIALLYSEPDAGPAPGTPEFMEMLGEFQSAMAAMADSGVPVDSSPLQPPQTATTVRVRNGEAQLSDGPFAEIKEQLGGGLALDASPGWSLALRATGWNWVWSRRTGWTERTCSLDPVGAKGHR